MRCQNGCIDTTYILLSELIRKGKNSMKKLIIALFFQITGLEAITAPAEAFIVGQDVLLYSQPTRQSKKLVQVCPGSVVIIRGKANNNLQNQDWFFIQTDIRMPMSDYDYKGWIEKKNIAFLKNFALMSKWKKSFFNFSFGNGLKSNFSLFPDASYVGTNYCTLRGNIFSQGKMYRYSNVILLISDKGRVFDILYIDSQGKLRAFVPYEPAATHPVEQQR